MVKIGVAAAVGEETKRQCVMVKLCQSTKVRKYESAQW